MEFKFKLSDSQKEDAIFNLINPNMDDGWVDSVPVEVYDDYALCFNFYENKYFRAYYTKDDTNDTVEITEKVDAYIVDLTQNELDIVNSIRETTSFEAMKEKLDNFDTLQEEKTTAETTYSEKVSEFEEEIEKLNNQISELQSQVTTYQSEEENLQNAKADLESKINDLQSDLSVLEQYQLDNENKEKNSYLDKFAAKLPEDIVNELREKLADFSVEDFKKEISMEVLNANEDALFNKKQEFIPKENDFADLDGLSGAEKILANRIKKKSQ